MITIRKENICDENRINLVNQAAFEQDSEARLVDRLRVSSVKQISLVAIFNNQIIGHILLTTAIIKSNHRQISGMGLAPLAVLPQFQRQGIGSQLLTQALNYSNQEKIPFIIVLGHPHFYSRFGFEKASLYGIKSEYNNIPDEAFMMYVADQNIIKNITGIAQYNPEFAKL